MTPWYPDDPPPLTFLGILKIIATGIVGAVFVWALLALTLVTYEGMQPA